MNPFACVPQIRKMSWEDKVAYLAYRAVEREEGQSSILHRFDDIWYVRQLYIKAGTCFISRKHTDGHIVKLKMGKVLLMFEVGQKYYEAPDVIHTRAGQQIVCIAQTDIIAETWHLNPEGLMDVKALEDQIAEPLEALLQRGKLVAGRVDVPQIKEQA